jgi:hypothetical protein
VLIHVLLCCLLFNSPCFSLGLRFAERMLLTCSVYRIFVNWTGWLGVVMVLPSNVFMFYRAIIGCGTNKIIRKGFSTLWLAYACVTHLFIPRILNSHTLLVPKYKKKLLIKLIWLIFSYFLGLRKYLTNSVEVASLSHDYRHNKVNFTFFNCLCFQKFISLYFVTLILCNWSWV